MLTRTGVSASLSPHLKVILASNVLPSRPWASAPARRTVLSANVGLQTPIRTGPTVQCTAVATVGSYVTSIVQAPSPGEDMSCAETSTDSSPPGTCVASVTLISGCCAATCDDVARSTP